MVEAPLSGVRPNDRVWLAICLSLIALFLFQCMGLIVKHLTPRYSPAELSAWRNFFGVAPSLIALWASSEWHARGRKLGIRQWRLSVIRGISVTMSQFLFYFALGKLAFATATTISFANAFFMTALAVPLLGEKVGLVRWSAVCIGFLGVVSITAPGTVDFGWTMLAPVGAAFGYALSGVMARLLDPDVPSALASLHSLAISCVGSFGLVLVLGGFTAPASWADFLWIATMGSTGGLAVLFLLAAFRMTEQSNLAPFSYFGIPIAFFLGWLFYGEMPFDDLFPGALLIMAGGILVVLRERQLKRRASP